MSQLFPGMRFGMSQTASPQQSWKFSSLTVRRELVMWLEPSCLECSRLFIQAELMQLHELYMAMLWGFQNQNGHMCLQA